MGAAVYGLQPITYKFLQNWNIFVLIAIGIAVYVGMLFVTKVVDKDMLNLLRKGRSGNPPDAPLETPL